MLLAERLQTMTEDTGIVLCMVKQQLLRFACGDSDHHHTSAQYDVQLQLGQRRMQKSSEHHAESYQQARVHVVVSGQQSILVCFSRHM